MNEPETGAPATGALLDASAPDPWAARRTEAVLARAEAFALDAAPTPQLRALLATALVGLRGPGPSARWRTFHLPLLVYGGLRGDDEPAIPLAAAVSLLYLGVDVCDDLADGDLPAHWTGYRPSEINLAGLTLLATLPQLAIAALEVSPSTRATMLATVARGLLQMAGGQQRDLSAAGRADVTPAAVEEAVAAKTGEELAMFAALGAQFAGAAPAVVERYAALGREIGTALQLLSDCSDVFSGPHSRDLANGTRTLPIALCLDRLTGSARGDFLALLDRAQQDQAARQRVCDQLQAAGVLWRSGIVVEVHGQRARRLLDELSPREPAAARLRELAARLSLLRQVNARRAWVGGRRLTAWDHQAGSPRA